MKLTSEYTMSDLVMSELIVSGIRPETYAIGLFISDMDHVGLHVVVDELDSSMFDVEVLDDGSWQVALIGMTDDMYTDLLLTISDRDSELGDRMKLVA